MLLEDIQTIAVVGAGTMGQGIVQVFAAAGFKTKLFDIDEKLIHNGMAAIRKNLAAVVEKGRLSTDQRLQIEKNIIPCGALSEVTADLIIEAIIEKMDVKQNLLREIEKINTPAFAGTATAGKQKVILVTNTSSLSVTRIASPLNNPDRCVGLHFFNPAHLMKLVEVVAGTGTDPELVALMMELSRKVGKIPVRAKDSPGFIVNRVARHFYVESLKVLEENVSDVPGIDRLLRSAGFKMGPFELMDLIGVDTNFAVTRSLYEAFYPDPKFMPSKLQQQKIDAGHLGRKTGKGFYDYAKN
jgi:3-hydroxybutyryl-CoA dehydrogenase